MPRRHHQRDPGSSQVPSQRQLRVGELVRHAMAEMLTRGELDATLLYLSGHNLVDRSRIDLAADPRVRALFPDRAAEGRRYYAKTGIYPINHTVVVRRALLEQHPWIALNLYAAFAASRAEVLRAGGVALASHFETGAIAEDVRRALATDPMAYGIKATRKVLETIADYVHAQGLTERRVKIEELFAASTMDL